VADIVPWDKLISIVRALSANTVPAITMQDQMLAKQLQILLNKDDVSYITPLNLMEALKRASHELRAWMDKKDAVMIAHAIKICFSTPE